MITSDDEKDSDSPISTPAARPYVGHPCAGCWRDPGRLLALGFGAGCIRTAPGTWGTLVAVPICWLLQPLPLVGYLAVAAAAFALGVWACEHTTRVLGMHDHPAIVWDEVVGYLVTMTAAPPGWRWLLIGFVLFRLFDILKPWPIRAADRWVRGGFGVMFDDLLAGIFAWLVLQGLVWLV